MSVTRDPARSAGSTVKALNEFFPTNSVTDEKPSISNEGEVVMEQHTLSGARAISRRGLLGGAAAISGLTVLGASFPRPALAQSATINVLTLGEGIFGQPFVDLSPEFTKATGIKVNSITMGYNEAIQKQAAAFAAKSSAYDVVQVDSIYVKGYAKAGHLQALDGLIPNDQLADYFGDIPATFKDMYSSDGKTYGLATIGNCQRFVYNEAHLKAVGLTAPQTWSDLLSAAQKVVDPSANRFGFVAGTERLAKAFSVWLPIFWANGGVLFDDKMKPVFADKTGIDALTFFWSWSKRCRREARLIQKLTRRKPWPRASAHSTPSPGSRMPI
jgi:ABC-type glycerol-3-phosphate transport system substrate-binding protein